MLSYLSEVIHHFGLVWLADEQNPDLGQGQRGKKQGQEKGQGQNRRGGHCGDLQWSEVQENVEVRETDQQYR